MINWPGVVFVVIMLSLIAMWARSFTAPEHFMWKVSLLLGMVLGCVFTLTAVNVVGLL